MKSSVFSLILIVILLSGTISCKRDQYKINISGISTDISVKRLEKELFSVDPEDIIGNLPAIKENFKGFLQLFSEVINTGDISDPEFGNYLVSFVTDRQNNEVYTEVMKVFPDTEMIEKGLENAFRHYLYYFPAGKVPDVYTCITGFNNSIITGDSSLGIGLDRYLGAECKYYPRLQIYNYLAARMTPEYVVSDCMFGWGASEWIFSAMNYPSENVLASMIHEGKLRYFQKCMLPEVKDEIIFGFTPAQMNFCRNNEGQMWHSLMENELLFKTDQFTIRKLTGEAPFTSYFTNESPGRAAVWIGFRIVESYMKKNQNISLEELMTGTDIQGMLESARYNPQ